MLKTRFFVKEINENVLIDPRKSGRYAFEIYGYDDRKSAEKAVIEYYEDRAKEYEKVWHHEFVSDPNTPLTIIESLSWN
jgi:hypothetical protein